MAVSRRISISFRGAADPPRNRRSGGYPSPGVPWSMVAEADKGFWKWRKPITAPSFESRRQTSGKSSAISTIIRSGSAAPAKAGSRTANPATPSARSGTWSIRSAISGSGCWRYPDVDRSQTYEFCGAPSLPVQGFQVQGFQATLRITPIVNGDRAFVEWWATFDCEPARCEEFSQTLRGWFAKWLESLRTVLSRQGSLEAVLADH
jgi:hypothetical protein